MINNPKKIVLFIVEGVSDKLALGPVLSQIIKSNNVKFKIMGGDITSDYYNVTLQNIVNKIRENVISFLGSIYKIEDIIEIVHIVDSDGAYIPDTSILTDSCDSPIYTDSNILTKNPYELKKRNGFKYKVLNILSSTTSIKLGRAASTNVKYSLFYMSCNLDHVLINDRNLDPALKKQKAIDFSDQYFGKPLEFYNFLSNTSILKGQSYNETWTYLRVGKNSLSRCSNLAIYLEKYFQEEK